MISPRCPYISSLTLGSVDWGVNKLTVLLGAITREAHMFLHFWSQSCGAVVTGTQAVQLVSTLHSFGNTDEAGSSLWRLRSLTGTELWPDVSQLHFTRHLAVQLVTRMLCSSIKQLPRMHFSSSRSDWATTSCSLTDWSQCWRRWVIWIKTKIKCLYKMKNTDELLQTVFQSLQVFGLPVCAHTHTLSRAVCVSFSSLWHRVLAVSWLHCSRSSHTAWPSNTAFQWWLRGSTCSEWITLFHILSLWKYQLSACSY